MNKTRSISRVALVLMMVALGLFAVACADADTNGDVGVDEDIGVNGTAEVDDTLEAITDNPSAYVGQQVTVDGDVNVVLNDQAFTIANETMTDDDEVLVINAGQVDPATLQEDTEVRVTGEVVQFTQADVEQQYGLDLDEQLTAEFEGRPAIVAQSIQTVDASG